MSARRSVLQRRALLVGAAMAMVGCRHREEDEEAHHGYDPVPPPCRDTDDVPMSLGVMRVPVDAGAGVTVLRLRPDAPGAELVEASVPGTVVGGLVQLFVPAKVEQVVVSFARKNQPGCDRGRTVQYAFDVALVPRDDQLSVRGR